MQSKNNLKYFIFYGLKDIYFYVFPNIPTYIQSKRDYALKVFQSKELTGMDFAPF